MNDFLSVVVTYIALIAGIGSCIVWYVAYRLQKNDNKKSAKR